MFARSPRTVLTLFLCWIPLAGGEEESLLAARDQAVVSTLAPGLGLAREDALQIAGIVPDEFTQGHDARVVQFHRGVRVLGGEGIFHFSGPRTRSVTDAFLRDLDVDPHPTVSPATALAAVLGAIRPPGPLRRPPTCELRVVRLGTGDVLAYRIHLEREGGSRETAHQDCLVDAHSGRILRTWSTLHTGRGAKGTGYSQYSGQVALNATQRNRAPGFELRDWTRGRTGNMILDLDHSPDETAEGNIFISPVNAWGDGLDYQGGPTSSPNGQTAAVDAAYGLQSAWDMFSRVFRRKGLDGRGRAVTLRVHYDTDYDNAFWSDTCFCVTFGDGQHFRSLTSLDIVGHELAHGVCATTAGLEYFGESGGLNEASSDIFGTLVEFYARGGSGDTIGNWGGNWTLGEDVARPEDPEPIRYLYKPSRDGSSPDAWSAELGEMDVHNASGPMNRCFFFLSQGASANRHSDFFSPHLPGGMEGLGNDRAGHIWYRALVHYLTSLSGYSDARRACITAAQDLYGPGGPEEKAVCNAFRAINVGPRWRE